MTKKSRKGWTNNLSVRAPPSWSGSLGHYNTCHVLYDAAYRIFTLWLFSSNRILRSPSDQVRTWPFPCHLSVLYVWCTTAYLSDVSSTILECYFNKDPQTLSSWLESNHLTVNSTKTQALSFGPCDYDYSLFLHDARIEFLKSVKILGVNLDKDLSYKEHISDQLKKVYEKASALRRIRRFLPHEAMMLNFTKHLIYYAI